MACLAGGIQAFALILSCGSYARECARKNVGARQSGDSGSGQTTLAGRELRQAAREWWKSSIVGRVSGVCSICRPNFGWVLQGSVTSRRDPILATCRGSDQYQAALADWPSVDQLRGKNPTASHQLTWLELDKHSKRQELNQPKCQSGIF